MTSSIRSIQKIPGKEHANIHALQESPTQSQLQLVLPQGQLQIHTSIIRGGFSVVLSESIRVAGLGNKVLVAQLLKGGVDQGPNKGIQMCGQLHWLRPSFTDCISVHKNTLPEESQIFFQERIKEIWNICKNQMKEGLIDRLVIDEIGLAISFGYLDINDLMSTLENKAPSTDVILTGPSIPAQIRMMADQVTELR
tara:strand:- start:7567 stop:8154 length:588 start_codon:yes stop_codon:yes gene_type:complete